MFLGMLTKDGLSKATIDHHNRLSRKLSFRESFCDAEPNRVSIAPIKSRRMYIERLGARGTFVQAAGGHG